MSSGAGVEHSTDDVIDRVRRAGIATGDTETFGQWAESLEYLKNHVEEFENGDIPVGSLNLDEPEELKLRLAVLFGIYWEIEVPHDR